MTLRVVSLFSGVGGFDLGLERAGMTTVAQVEWDKKCQSVLARHWPDVPRWGDVSEVRSADLPDCDLVAFGSPCQDLSVAGKRAGMVEGETRSGLFYEAVRIIKEMQHDGRGPAWVVWENVVGALSSNGGRDFGAVLDALADLGAVDLEWRVLDAQFFGVPQRRRRVFVVARLDPRAAGADEVLPFPARVRRNPAKGGEAGQEVAGTLGGGSGSRGWAPDTDRMTFVPDVVGTLSPFVKAKRASSPDDDESWKPGEVAPTLNAFDNGGDSRATVATVQDAPPDLAVRRLTPRECERLQGYPDDWTRFAADGSEVADSSRYRMCGNGVASPVAEWLGRCIVAAHEAVNA